VELARVVGVLGKFHGHVFFEDGLHPGHGGGDWPPVGRDVQSVHDCDLIMIVLLFAVRIEV